MYEYLEGVPGRSTVAINDDLDGETIPMTYWWPVGTKRVEIQRQKNEVQTSPTPLTVLYWIMGMVMVNYQLLLVHVLLYVCMYLFMVITHSRVWINRVRLPALLVVS